MKKIVFATFLFFTTLIVMHTLLRRGERHSFFARVEGREEREDEKETDQPGKFLIYHRGLRTPADKLAPGYSSRYKWEAIASAREQSLARKRSGRTKANGVLEWKERGPGNVPGRTRALYNIPGDAQGNTWLAGAATGGIWRTADGGVSWTERSADFPAMPISCFGADDNATVIYAGTGEFVSSLYSAIGNGIWKSTDKGLTWTQLASTSTGMNDDFAIVTRLVVDPSDPDIIVATTVPHNLTLDETSSIMRSIDGGQTWTKVKEVEGFFEQIIAQPDDFTVQYASQNAVGVWKSTDAGVTWNLSNAGMTATGRVEIAVSPSTPGTVFASVEGLLSGTNADLYYSTDSGATWSLVNVRFNGDPLDFFEGQGFYDNTILCDPFEDNIVYFGGVSLFRAAIGASAGSIDNYQLEPVATDPFLLLQSFSGAPYDNQRLVAGTPLPTFDVEIRFGPGISQKAHRFLVPVNETSSVPAGDYAYMNYVTVPFQVWDVTNNRQLMVSFRDQNRNGAFDLLAPYLTADGLDYLLNSREYLYIHTLTYNTSASPEIDQAGGHEVKLAFNLFPALAGNSWDPASLPVSQLNINHHTLAFYNATTVTVADGRGSFDNKNRSNQVDLDLGVHPDHHFLAPVITNATAETYKLIVANDGGVFVSKSSKTPGIAEGDWTFRGIGLNTSQFYGADKKPGADEYIGGMQDNGTRMSPRNQPASRTSPYTYGLGGDGFEAIWNSKDPAKLLASVYNGDISRSLDGGQTWQSALSGLVPGNEFPFVTKLANSKDYPERVFTVGSQGVYVSNNFGGSWQLTPIATRFVAGNALYLDVEVSRANANIVWAGSGMNNTGTLRNLHVSTDGGKTFTATTNFTSVTLGNITKLASHPLEENTAYALFSFSDRPKILRTTDRGQTWNDISGFGAGTSSTNGFPDVAVYCLYVRADNPEILWAGTEIGIVESLDNGQTWNLLEDFPSVSVWDMKGQDDQVVIATHGRGIWTAVIDQPQAITQPAEVIAAGTSPLEKLMIRIQSPEAFDKVDVYVNTTLVHTLTTMAPGQTEEVALDNMSHGEKEINLVCFKGTKPYQSNVFKTKHLDILGRKNSYSTYFNSLTGLSADALLLQHFPVNEVAQRKILMTENNYGVNKTYQVTVLTPVEVAPAEATLYYSDIAIIEPGNDNVVAEATKNGLDWLPLSQPYDAAFAGDTQGKWLTAYTNQQPATRDMFIDHKVDIGETFAPGDLLLFRFRMTSGPETTSWGWVLDYISIQEPPREVELPSSRSGLTLYPNPSPGTFSIDYSMEQSSDVTLTVADVFGRIIFTRALGLKTDGLNYERVDLGDLRTGTYIIVLYTDEGNKVGKLSVRSD